MYRLKDNIITYNNNYDNKISELNQNPDDLKSTKIRKRDSWSCVIF